MMSFVKVAEFFHPLHQIVKGESGAKNKVPLHLGIVGFPVIDLGCWRKEVNLVRGMEAVVNVFEIVVRLAVFQDGVVEVAVGKGFSAVRRIHQALQVVEMTAHTAVTGFGFLELFIEEEHFLQKGTRRHDRTDGTGELVIFLWKELGYECIDGPELGRFVHRKATDFNLDARRNIKKGKYKISAIADMLGFSSPSHFAAQFKKQFGVLPSQYFND